MVRASGALVHVRGRLHSGQGKENARQLLKDNPDLAEEPRRSGSRSTYLRLSTHHIAADDIGLARDGVLSVWGQRRAGAARGSDGAGATPRRIPDVDVESGGLAPIPLKQFTDSPRSRVGFAEALARQARARRRRGRGCSTGSEEVGLTTTAAFVRLVESRHAAQGLPPAVLASFPVVRGTPTKDRAE